MSTFIALLKTMSTFFTSFPQIFFKDFFKERRYLHFICSIVITFLSLLFAYRYMYIEDLPILFIVFLGWYEAYAVNWAREWYYNYKSKYETSFDYLDIYAGAYGGIVASIIYLIII